MSRSHCIRFATTLLLVIIVSRLIDSEAAKHGRYQSRWPFCRFQHRLTVTSKRQTVSPKSIYKLEWQSTAMIIRGGEQDVGEMSLDQKVHAAMRKLGLTLPDDLDSTNRISSESNGKVQPPPPPRAVKGANNFEKDIVCEGDVCHVSPPKIVPPPPLPPKISSTREIRTELHSNASNEFEETSRPIQSISDQLADNANLETLLDAGVNDERNFDVEETKDQQFQSSAASVSTSQSDNITEDPRDIAELIAKELNVDVAIVMAALVATSTSGDHDNNRIYNEAAAREMIELELQMINKIPENCTEIEKLVSEGHSAFLSRRALAFAERNVEDARAILLADQLDEEDQRKRDVIDQTRIAKQNVEASFKAVNVKADFDPTAIDTKTAQFPIVPPTSSVNKNIPEATTKDSVVFEATAAQVRDLVIESPVPVLLDVYADWCGPCKTLSPILEEMAVKGGGAFRLVKLNSDKERELSSALEVTALPTVFGVNNGRIINMFRGMPRSEEMMRNFLMGLIVPGQSFQPPVSEKDKYRFEAMSSKMLKIACAASYPFSARERLGERVTEKLADLVREAQGDVIAAEDSAQTVKSLLNNVIKDPFNVKFRRVNLDNKTVATKVARFTACLSILKAAGFAIDKTNTNSMSLTAARNSINISPLIVARDAIEKWIDATRYEVSKESRRRKDELDLQNLEINVETKGQGATDEDDEVEVADPNQCTLHIRFEGKKKSYEHLFRANDSLQIVLSKVREILNTEKTQDGDGVFQFTCVARRLVVVSSDTEMMSKSLRDLKLVPYASLVVARVHAISEKDSPKLAERAANRKKRKTGSHTMQSIGIYAKDDNAKGELIDGGGGTLFEHDVTDDETETNNNPSSSDESPES